MHKKLMKFFRRLEAFLAPTKNYLLQFSIKEKSSKLGEKKLINPQRVFTQIKSQIIGPQHAIRKYQSAQQFFATKKTASFSLHDKIFNVILRYLNTLAIDTNRQQFWTPQLLETHKNKRRSKSINSYFFKQFSNGRDELLEAAKSLKSALTAKTENRYDNQQKKFEPVFKTLADHYNGTAEQKVYTLPNSPLGKKPPKRQYSDQELPPPQKCRLSCPLPPPEYCPIDKTDFLPTYQSPSVKFCTQPAEFLPPKISKNNLEYYSLKTEDRIFSGQAKPQKRSQSILPKSQNYKKIYPSAFKQYKPPFYEPKPDNIPKMKALLFEPLSLELNYYAVEAPTQIHKDEVLVQVIYSGVCGTDISITEGKMFCRNEPLILGHEISGKVYAVGSEVTHVKSGDNVAVNPYTACCICRYCTKGYFSSCLNEGLNNSIGVSKNGGWAEFVVVKKSQIYKVPQKLGLDQAALIQPLSCVLSAMSKLNLSNDLDIMIQGLGLTGCLWASVLHAKGHKNVFVSDRNEKKKEQFEALNLDYPFITKEDMPFYTADVIIECTGSPSCIEKSLKILNPNGQICFFGKSNPLAEIRCIPYEIVKKEITIVGHSGNAFCFSKAVDLATMMGYRYLDFDKLGVKVFDLQDFREAFQMKKSEEVGKIMFKFES